MIAIVCIDVVVSGVSALVCYKVCMRRIEMIKGEELGKTRNSAHL